MGETVRRILADNPSLQPGDVLVTNDPYRGGSHLPDVTVVTPVHDPASGQLAVLHRQPRPSCRDRRHRARLDAAVLAQSGRRRGADSQLQLFAAGQPRWDELREAVARGPLSQRATSRRTWPTSRPRWPPIAAARRDCWPLVERYVAARRAGLHAAHPERPPSKSAPGTGALGRRHATASSTIWTTARRSPSRSRSAATRPVFDFAGTRAGLAGQSERQPRRSPPRP